MNNHKINLYKEGLEEACTYLNGDETIYSGIRPRGYHAGNRIVISVYPYIIAKQISEMGLDPEFNYVITLNDMEPESYDFELFRPTSASIAFTGKINTIISEIQRDIQPILKEFPRVNINFIKSSDLIDTAQFKKATKYLIEEKDEFIRRYIKSTHLANHAPSTMHFIGLMCDMCKTPSLSMDVNENTFEGYCETCERELSGRPEEVSFWMYYVPLIAMKLSVLQPDIVLLGCDYIQTENERQESLTNKNPLDSIIEFYDGLCDRPLNFLLSPVLLGKDGRKMGKQFDNLYPYSYEDVYSACNSQSGRELKL